MEKTMDISPPITIKKEGPAEILSPSEDNSGNANQENTNLKLTELYMLALHNLYELIPEQRKATLTTGDSIILEAANYALDLEKSFHENKEINEDISIVKISGETFSLSTKEELKRPRNGFIRYSMEHRKEMASLFPYMENRKISRLLGSKWRKLSETERKPYEDEFKEDMKTLQEKYPKWMYSTSKKNPTEKDLKALLLPTRLRPRNKIKRKVHNDCFEEIYLKSSGCKRKRRKMTAVTAKVKPNDLDDDGSRDLMNKSFVETILMPPPGTADTGIKYSTEPNKKFDQNMNKSFVETILMPPAGTADTGNEYSAEFDKNFDQNMNKSFVETILMPSAGTADTGNEYSAEFDKKYDQNMNKSFVETILMPSAGTADTCNEYSAEFDKKFDQNMNKSFVETILMPPAEIADTGNKYPRELDKKFNQNINKSIIETILMPSAGTADKGNDYSTKLDKKFDQNINNDFLSVDLENEISKLNLDYSNHLWLKWLDEVDTLVPGNDLLTLESKNAFTNIKTELV